jgi:hypothetical protein
MWVDKEFLGAFKMGHKKKMREFLDQEYAHTLLKEAKKGCLASLEALKFLAKFNNEYYKARKLNEPDAFHNTQELRAECHARNNRAERSVEYNAELIYIQTSSCEQETYPSEDELIKIIDILKEYEATGVWI